MGNKEVLRSFLAGLSRTDLLRLEQLIERLRPIDWIAVFEYARMTSAGRYGPA